MQHRMAVGTNWSQVRDRINFVLMANSRQLSLVVDVNESFSHRTVDFPEVESTHLVARFSSGAVRVVKSGGADRRDD